MFANSCFTIYSVEIATGHMSLSQRIPIANSMLRIRSIFCPLLSLRKGLCIVSASESNEVHVIDLAVSPKISECITKLMGHTSPVLDVSWSYDETLLASCDKQGYVILWKREGGLKNMTSKMTEASMDEQDLATETTQSTMQ